jgi:hypothetical protein
MKQMKPELKQLAAEASRALASLDADRLEELARSCHALNRALPNIEQEAHIELARQAGAATGDLAVFGRVLEATRANLEVMNRLRELQMGRLEYGQPSSQRPFLGGSFHGDN